MKIKINNNLYFNSEGPPLLIAEISSNHCGSKKKFLQHILEAKKSGADLVKIQTYEVSDMTINNKFKIESGTWKGLNLSSLYKKAQTPFEWHYDAFKLAKKNKICLFSTPFSLRALSFLKKFNPPIYKVASFEITDHNLITEIAKTNKPIIISTGLANIKEIKEAIKIIKKFHNKIILLHCISGYPTSEEDINLNQIKFFKKKLKYNFVGLSDHTKDIKAASLASLFKISAIEKHFIIKKSKKSPDNNFSITPKKLKLLKKNIINYYKIMGKDKLIRPKSEKSSHIFRRSIYSTKFIKKGDLFTKKNIGCYRPNLGISSSYFFKIINKKSPFNIKENTPIKKKIIRLLKI